MTNIKVLLSETAGIAKVLLSAEQRIELVNDLEHADYVLQDASFYRAGAIAPVKADADGLTRRELEVLRLTAEGRSVKQAAFDLGLSAKTVDAHKVNLMRKLKIHNKAQLVQYAFRNGILKLADSEPAGNQEMTPAAHC